MGGIMADLTQNEKMLQRLKIRLELFEIKEDQSPILNAYGQPEMVKKTVFDDSQDLLLEEMIAGAKALFLSLRYPTTGASVSDDEPIIEKRFHDWILRCAEEMYGKIGGAGQVSHSENSIKRVWESGSISDSLRAEVVPLIGLANR